MAERIALIHFCVLLLEILSFSTRNTHAYHDVLETTVVDENNRDIKLKWVKTKRSFLANENLPIWDIRKKGKLNIRYRSRKDKNEFIDYIAYHDLDQSSAVIYVKEHECLIGVIDTRYSINCLPISQLDGKHHVAKNRVDGYIIQINSDHCDSSCYNNPSTIPNLSNPSPFESGSFSPMDLDSIRLEYGETIRKYAPNLELSKLTNTNLKELPSTSFNPDSSLSHGPDSFINPSFPNSESSIIYNNKASTLHLPNADVATELANSYLPLVSSQFENSVSSLPSDTASSSNPPPGFIDFDNVLPDNHKSSKEFPSSSYIDDLLYSSGSLNIDLDDTFFQSQETLDFAKLTDTDLKRLLHINHDSVSPSTRDSDHSIKYISPDPNLDLFHFSESSTINHDEPPSLLNLQSPMNLDFSSLTNTVLDRYSSSTSDIYSPPIKRPRIEKRSDKKQLDTLYPEILIFVSNDMVNYEKNVGGQKNYLSRIIYRFIAYFNAVDMLFAQLAKYGINIHVNIAGILIDKCPNALRTCLGIQDYLHAMDKSPLDYIQQFIKKKRRTIGMDSFDFFHSATIAKLTEGDHNYGLSTERFSVFDQRTNEVSRSNMKIAGSIVKHTEYIQNYVVAAREIAHLMEVDYETTENSFGNDAQCPGLMQKHNIRCLKWSDKSIESFKKYVSESLDRCFLLNHPKSLFPINKPIELIPPAKMCSCYVKKKQHSEMIKSIAVISENCDAPMVCLKPDVLGILKPITPLPLPLDGTGCGENKVCFERKCVMTSIVHGHKES